jgi:hypothetical protein
MGRIRAQSLGLEALGAHPALASYLTLEDVTRKRCFSLSRAIADAPRHIARYEPGLVPQRKSDFLFVVPRNFAAPYMVIDVAPGLHTTGPYADAYVGRYREGWRTAGILDVRDTRPHRD